MPPAPIRSSRTYRPTRVPSARPGAFASAWVPAASDIDALRGWTSVARPDRTPSRTLQCGFRSRETTRCAERPASGQREAVAVELDRDLAARAQLAAQDRVRDHRFDLAHEQVPQRTRAQAGVAAGESYQVGTGLIGERVADAALLEQPLARHGGEATTDPRHLVGGQRLHDEGRFDAIPQLDGERGAGDREHLRLVHRRPMVAALDPIRAEVRRHDDLG